MMSAVSSAIRARDPGGVNGNLARSRLARSRISNGNALLAGVDGRSIHARRFRDLVLKYRALTGDRPEAEDLVRSIAALIVYREALDSKIARGEIVDTEYLVRLAGGINRGLTKIWLLVADEKRKNKAAEPRSKTIEERAERELRAQRRRDAFLPPEEET